MGPDQSPSSRDGRAKAVSLAGPSSFEGLPEAWFLRCAGHCFFPVVTWLGQRVPKPISFQKELQSRCWADIFQ